MVNSLKRSTPCIQAEGEKVPYGSLCLLNSLMTWSWRLLLTGLTTLVILVGLGRLMFSTLPVLLPELSGFLSDRLQADLQIESMSAKWNDGQPWFSLRGLRLKGKDADVTGFSITQLDMELSLRESLLHWTPVFSSLEIDGVNVELVRGEGAQWALSGIQRVAGSSLQAPEYHQSSALEWLALQKKVDIRDIRLNMRKANGESSDVHGQHLTVVTDGDQKNLSARLEVGTGYLAIDGSGIASRGQFSQWQGAAVASDLNAEQLCVLWSGCYDDVLSALIQLETRWLYDNGVWQVQGEVASPDVTYRDNAGTLNHLSGQTHLFMQGVLSREPLPESSWQIWLNGLKLENRLHNGTVYQWENSWYLTGGRAEEYTVTVATEKLDLDLLKRWLLDTDALPESVADLVNTLNPIGQLNDLAIRFFPSRQPFDFDLSARLDNVSVDAWRGAPSGGNVSGQLRMNLLQGYLDLDTRNFQLGFPKLFRETWTFDTARARLYWDVIDDFYILKSDDLALVGPEGDLKGKLRLDIPLQWHEGDTLDMALTVGMSNGDARYTGKYLPALLPMNSGLVHWLDTAIQKADISGGGFIYNGALASRKGEDISPPDARWGLFFDLHNGELDYAPDWPAITGLTGQVYVNDDRVEVLGQRAESAGGKLDDIVARVPLDGKSILRISSHLNASGETLQHFLTRTPINDWMNGEAKQWTLQGQLDAGLNLTLPLNDLGRSEVDIRAALESFTFGVPEVGIAAKGIAGDLSYSTGRGLTARQLSGEMFGQSAQFQIRSMVQNQQPVSIDIVWSGRVSVSSLQDWLKLDWLSLLEGETDYRASLSLADNNTELRVDSELLGVDVELPAPVGKAADTPLPLAFSLTKKEGHQLLGVTLATLGRLDMKMTSAFSPESALITLGDDASHPGAGSAMWPSGNQFLVTGTLPELDLGPWKACFEGQPGSPDEQQLASRIALDNVRLGSLKYGDYLWPDISVSLQQAVHNQRVQPDRKGMKLAVDGQTLKGDLWIPEQKTVPWVLYIDRVHLPEPASEASAKHSPLAAEDSLADINPATLPNLDVNINHIQVGSRTPASIGFKLRHAPNGVRIDNITGELSGMSLNGLADWVQIEGEQRSWVQGRLKGKGIRELQKALGFSGFLEARESRFDVSLNWDGSPLGGSMATMKGRIDLLLKQGRLRKVDNGSSEALKLFGIFNTEALARRMRLDFSDLYSSGISFDQIKGSLNFNRGLITFNSPMVIEGTTSDFKLDGTIDTNTEQLDLSLVVTLPVSSNLPILSVLLGTAPQVAGIIYIADKLVGKQVDQLASIRYRIHGSFDDPEMTLDRLFSNKPKK
ncbi:YhdP family protein [Endozoicomonas sp. YOMI1]|uniref:YhdP family protein n=1 Tax=Endozoicomonas sp. YOMI1 TaxID=2828739 RepID=UPI0021483A5B|nr:YhdP family protein [Endozoicomonas sp. YOMI1]